MAKDARTKALASKKEKEPYFGLPHGAKDTPELRRRFKNYVKHNEKHGGFGPGDRANKYKLQRDNSYYQFNKKEYD